VHLGIDLFAAPGTTVHAPLAGRVHSLQDNAAPLDYGPTVILEHRIDSDTSDTGTDTRFWTLYGHLAKSCLTELSEGQKVARGQAIAEIGDYPSNGNWPPHLHFQIVLDLLDKSGDFPGVAPPSERELWKALCPDPTRLLHLPPQSVAEADSPEALVERRRRHLSSTLSVSYAKPLHIVRGYGAHLYDAEGRPYLDLVNNVCHVGHAHPKVVRAAAEQMAVLNTNTRYLHENLVEYAERLTAKLPDPLNVCFFVNSGSEANDLALRLARNHTGRRGTMVLDGAYHGNLTSLIEVSPYKFDGPGGAGAPEHVTKLPMPDGYRGRFRSSEPQYAALYIEAVEETLRILGEGGTPPGVVLAESIMSCAGQIVLPPGYLKRVFELVRAAGGVAIADEVQVGFGRSGSHFWAFQAEEAMPDIVTMGKPIGNGHPIGAVVTTEEVARSFETGMEYFNTFGGNPVSCAAGLAVLEVLEEESLQENAEVVGRALLEGLRQLADRHAIIGDVRGRGLFVGFELVRDRDPERLEPAREEAKYLVNRMRDERFLTSTDGPFDNVIKLKPPLVIRRAEVDRYLSALDNVLQEERLRL
jgi:4-aminobutyrate aminotransferase-like enzyme